MEKEVSCLNSKVILGYVKEHNNGDYSGLLKNLDPEIDILSDPESFLTDPNNWISCAVATKLYERARIILDDEMAAGQRTDGFHPLSFLKLIKQLGSLFYSQVSFGNFCF